MNSMLQAIKKRRSSEPMDVDSGEEMGVDHGAKPGREASGMHDLVASLDEAQRAELKNVLDQSMKAASEIQKGGPSTKEKMAISEESEEENMMNDMEAAKTDMDDGESSDDVAMSMLDHRSKTAGPDEKPRNLGERVKMGLAQKLKGKGKL